MDNVHGAHCAASVVKDPFLLDVDVVGQLLAQLVDNVLDNGLCVVTVRGNAALRQILQMVEVEDVELVEVLLGNVEDGGQQRREQREDAEERGRGAVGLGCRRFLVVGSGHCCFFFWRARDDWSEGGKGSEKGMLLFSGGSFPNCLGPPPGQLVSG